MFPITLHIETEKEDDGRWLADVPKLPGCMVYGESEADAVRRVQVLAFRVIADCLEHGEDPFTGKPLGPRSATKPLVESLHFAHP